MECLLKSQIFAIRGEEWLHRICPIPGQISSETMLETIADEEEEKDYQQLSWFKKLITIRGYKRWKKFYNNAYHNEKYKEHCRMLNIVKISEWDNTRKVWELIEVKKGAVFSDHLIIIKNKKTQKVYYCYCNNHGGSNSHIILHENSNSNRK